MEKKGRNYHGVDNLSYGTYEQNNGVDRVRDGTDKRGENHGCAKLNEMQVRVIRRLLESKAMTQKEIADIFGVETTTIGHIKRGKTWQHL
jgi:predicted XRE-type DNA-binding protein